MKNSVPVLSAKKNPAVRSVKNKSVILSAAHSAQSKDLFFPSMAAALFFACFLLVPALIAQNAAHPGARVVMDAHNCYPYDGKWSDRIDRALSAGTPLAIEQDLAWFTDKTTGKSWSIVSHSTAGSGQEPTMKQYFFERVRPIVEKALRDGNHGNWPLITLNLDFKSNEPEHLRAVLALLHEYQGWLTTAPRTSSDAPQPLDVKPILVLTGDNDTQQKVFYDDIPVGGKVLLFGAVHTNEKDPMAAPEVLESERVSNYRRWWNNPWAVVEAGGQNKAGDWTKADDLRLRALVQHAHQNGLWIRFYTLDGVDHKEDLSKNGWFSGYNFGSYSAAETRWRAAIAAGVDYIASDQYEALGKLVKKNQSLAHRASAR